MQRKLVLVLWLVFVLTIITTGCSTGNSNNEVILESGVIDTDYMGEPNPQLVVKMKLTPEERAGNFEKVPAKTSSSAGEPETIVEEESSDQKADEADAPRPKI